ncbi:MAG: hemolysin, partial [Muribaculaceae bacterium]|nr:hemolysin [Muribaculaceae bacterium]
YEFSGRAEIENINEEFGLDIKESEAYHTLGGYILDSLGALPRQGDTFEIDGLEITIIRMAATKIELVKVKKK